MGSRLTTTTTTRGGRRSRTLSNIHYSTLPSWKLSEVAGGGDGRRERGSGSRSRGWSKN